MENTFVAVIKTLFRRDLMRLHKEIESYQDEARIWVTDKAIPNSAGNLTLHLIGNINHFVGAILGESGYVRQRELEFSMKNVPRHQLLTMIEQTIQVVDMSLDQVTDAQTKLPYPAKVFDFDMTTEYFLIHLVNHLGYHLGQVNYHRRLLDQH